MKIRLFAALMIALLMFSMSGCSLRTLETKLDALEESIDQNLDAAEPPAAGSPTYNPTGTESSANLLTKEEAEAIALNHAGFTADQLLYLRSEWDYDHGRREYNIEFQIDRWEYDYEIHAETGEILSWDKDWDD